MTEQKNEQDQLQDMIVEETTQTTDIHEKNDTTRLSSKKFYHHAGFYGVIGGVASSLLLCGAFALTQSKTTPPTTQVTTQSASTSTATLTPNKAVSTNEENAVTSAVENVKDAIVSVSNYQNKANQSDFFSPQTNRQTGTLQKAGEGSGVVYATKNGYAYVVTNKHVVDNADELNVTLKNGKTVSAELVGSDALTDLAVLKIKSEHVTKVATFANSDNVKVGQTALAIGYPLSLDNASTVTKGIISAVNRSVKVDTNGDNVPDWTMETLQTDAAINPGNSGGALVDLNGNVVGINSMKISNTSVEGIGFAIPSNQVVNIINQLEKDGKVTRPFLGAGLADLNDVSTSQRESLLKLPESVTQGVAISSIQSGSSADMAGLKKYDVIVSWNGKPITSTMDLRKQLYSQKIGETAELEVYRNGKSEKVKVTLSAQNQS